MQDTKHSLLCPACGRKMAKIYISDLEFCIDICTEGCGGLFFDNRELQNIIDSEEVLNKIIHYLDNESFKKVNGSDERICPLCKTPMVKIGHNSTVVIDVCNSCGAKFLDNDELQKIKSIKKGSF